MYTSPMRALNLWSPKTKVHPPCIFYRYEIYERYHFDGSQREVARIHGEENNTVWNTYNTDTVYLEFFSEMTVMEQFWAYTGMSYIAENGGFVGLFLGYSVLHLQDVVNGVINAFVQKGSIK